MKLTKLQLENFRNYLSYGYKFPDDKNIIVLVGENGRGKTNLLEAIYLLSIGRSFRTFAHDDLIKWEEQHLRCKGDISADNEETSLEVFYTNTPAKKKNFKKNDVNLKNSEFVGSLLTVLFHPEDLNMLYLGPSYRRKYMDILLSQVDREYLVNLTQYRKTLKQRNALLTEIRNQKFKNQNIDHFLEDLDTWDETIANFGSIIIKKRERLIKYLKENLQKIYQSISGHKENIKIEYKCNVSENYKDKLSQKRDHDIRRAVTSIGPHRDDIKFYINKKEINSTASRGEYRSLLLAIKLAEINYIKEKTKLNPILLLDDVFSELDRKRQSHLLKSIKDCQAIITTTNSKDIEKLSKESSKIGFVKIE
jgi:DNA replication and repair protein RecF